MSGTDAEPTRQPRPELPWHRKLLFAAGMVVVGLLLIEGLFSTVWLLVDLRSMASAERIVQRPANTLKPGEHLENYHSQYDEELGWVHIPGRRIEDFYGPGLHMSINRDGLRGKGDYIGNKPAGIYRAVFVGDSMTMGYGLDDEQTYPARLQRINNGVQAINMGMGGYSTCQFGIWYRRMHERLDADLVIFALIANDVSRIAGQPPQFSVIDGRVVVTNIPVPRHFSPNPFEIEAFRLSRFLVEHSDTARTIEWVIPRKKPSAPGATVGPVALTRAMIAELAALVRNDSRDFAVVMLPNSSDIPGHEDFNLESQRIFWIITQMVEDVTGKLDIPYLNLLPTFASQPAEDLADSFLDEIYAHYSPQGTELIARSIDAWLAEHFERYPRP